MLCAFPRHKSAWSSPVDDLELQALRKALTRMQDEQIPRGPLRKHLEVQRPIRPRQRKTIAHDRQQNSKRKDAA